MKHVENLLSLYSRRPSPNILSFARPTAQVSPSLTTLLATSPSATQLQSPKVAFEDKVATNHGPGKVAKVTIGQSLHETNGQKTPEPSLSLAMKVAN